MPPVSQLWAYVLLKTKYQKELQSLRASMSQGPLKICNILTTYLIVRCLSFGLQTMKNESEIKKELHAKRLMPHNEHSQIRLYSTVSKFDGQYEIIFSKRNVKSKTEFPSFFFLHSLALNIRLDKRNNFGYENACSEKNLKKIE